MNTKIRDPIILKSLGECFSTESLKKTIKLMETRQWLTKAKVLYHYISFMSHDLKLEIKLVKEELYYPLPSSEWWGRAQVAVRLDLMERGPAVAVGAVLTAALWLWLRSLVAGLGSLIYWYSSFDNSPLFTLSMRSWNLFQNCINFYLSLWKGKKEICIRLFQLIICLLLESWNTLYLDS